MIVEVRINELPESVADGTLVLWHKKPGDAVKTNEPLAEIETDKVVLEIAAPSDGTLSQQLCAKGGSVKRGDVIATIESNAAQAASPVAKPAPPPAPAKSVLPAKAPAALPAKAPVALPARAPAALPARVPAALPARAPSTPVAKAPPAPDMLTPAPMSPTPPLVRVPAAIVPAGPVDPSEAGEGLFPAVRRLLEEHQLSSADVVGTGPRGRITKEDVLRHLANSPQLASRIGEAPTLVELSQSAAAASDHEVLAARPTTRVKMTRLRARIAERMLEAQRSAAILTTFNEVNMQALTNLRHTYRESFLADHGVKLGIMGFFVKACTLALKRYPVINASVDGDDIVYHGYFDIGVAVSTGRGLVVPVLRNADALSLAESERAIAAFASKGEEGKLTIDELTGGTFTISNGGIFGSMLSTPILNAPQSAILGLHRIEPRPVAEGDKVVIRPMMYLALSYDHRIIDGREAVLFLTTVKSLVEDPTRFLLQA